LDDDCPDKLKILVNDRIRAYHKIEAARAELFKSFEGKKLSGKEALKHCKDAVDNFELNRIIFEELDYYELHQEILGHHPIFKEEVRQREVQEMSLNDAHKALRNIRTYISKEKRNLKNARTEASRTQILEKIKDWEERLKLIAEKIKSE